jgi:hypothetical protein
MLEPFERGETTLEEYVGALVAKPRGSHTQQTKLASSVTAQIAAHVRNWVGTGHRPNVRYWRVGDQGLPPMVVVFQSSVCSAIRNASSISMPRYRTRTLKFGVVE